MPNGTVPVGSNSGSTCGTVPPRRARGGGSTDARADAAGNYCSVSVFGTCSDAISQTTSKHFQLYLTSGGGEDDDGGGGDDAAASSVLPRTQTGSRSLPRAYNKNR